MRKYFKLFEWPTTAENDARDGAEYDAVIQHNVYSHLSSACGRYKARFTSFLPHLAVHNYMTIIIIIINHLSMGMIGRVKSISSSAIHTAIYNRIKDFNKNSSHS